jgi:hypothetical protein
MFEDIRAINKNDPAAQDWQHFYFQTYTQLLFIDIYVIPYIRLNLYFIDRFISQLNWFLQVLKFTREQKLERDFLVIMVGA